MKSIKVLVSSAAALTSICMASVSFADNTTTSPAAPATTSATTTTTVATPSAPSTTATQTTTTTLDATGTAATPVAPAPVVPTSTTTMTSADAAAVSAVPMEQDSVTVYNKKTPNKALLITGGALFLSTYVTTAAINAGNGRPGGVDDHLYIPIAGPWINIGNTSHETRDDVLLVGSGILQGVGAGLAIASFFVPEKVEAAKIHAGNVKMNISPTSYTGGGGLGAFGTF